MEAPYHLLRQQEHADVGDDLHTRGAEHYVWERVAFARKVKFPDGSVRATLHIEQENA